MNQPITTAEYITLQTAYDFFNQELFAGKLPQCLITLQRKKGARGYFSPDRFSGRGFEGKAHELALNPDCFVDRTDEEILSTLVHEQAHVWQQESGKPARKGYHNKEWASKMKDVGLYPSDTAQPDGKETGQKVSHYIIEGGVFSLAWAKLAKTGIKLSWESKGKAIVRTAKAESKVKYTCPNCEANAWAKPEANLLCGACSSEDGGLVDMIAA
jgi:hypothetical protein